MAASLKSISEKLDNLEKDYSSLIETINNDSDISASTPNMYSKMFSKYVEQYKSSLESVSKGKSNSTANLCFDAIKEQLSKVEKCISIIDQINGYKEQFNNSKNKYNELEQQKFLLGAQENISNSGGGDIAKIIEEQKSLKQVGQSILDKLYESKNSLDALVKEIQNLKLEINILSNKDMYKLRINKNEARDSLSNFKNKLNIIDDCSQEVLSFMKSNSEYFSLKKIPGREWTNILIAKTYDFDTRLDTCLNIIYKNLELLYSTSLDLITKLIKFCNKIIDFDEKKDLEEFNINNVSAGEVLANGALAALEGLDNGDILTNGMVTVASTALEGLENNKQSYTVKKGDWLIKIANKYGVDWHDLYEANKDVIGDNPNLIYPGQVLIIPGAIGVATSTKDDSTSNSAQTEKQSNEETKTTATTEGKEETKAEEKKSAATTEKKEETKTEETKATTTPKEETSSKNSAFGIELQYSAPYTANKGTKLNTVNGKISFNGHTETYYSTQEPGQNVTARDIPGKHVASDGTIRDKDGYICLAMPLKESTRKQYGYDFFDVVLTSLGPGKIYDCGTVGNTIDIYTNWDV